jgi:hypothetical protein
LIFSRKKDPWKLVENELHRLIKEINEVQRKRAEIDYLGRKAAAGLLTPDTITAGTPGDKLEELHRLTVLKNYFNYKRRWMQLLNQLDQDISKLKEEVAEIETKISEPLSLKIIKPQKNAKLSGTLSILWSATGPIGDNLTIYLLKKDIQFRIISWSVPTKIGIYEWRIPPEIPPASDYKVLLFDRATGLTVISEEFEIK